MNGLPLLSGPLPDYYGPEPSCRKCDKEFNILFQRRHRCNHCGYSYCSSCASYHALMPHDSGHSVVPVCAFCRENLAITAAGKNHLRSLPLSKLKKYMDAYNIKAERVVEKDDLVDILISARRPNGCLSPANEDYYRKHSVPNKSSIRSRGIFNRQTGPPPQSGPRPQQQTSNHFFPRPDVDSRWAPPPPRTQTRPSSTNTAPRPQPAYETRPNSQHRSPPPTAPRPSPSSNLNAPTPNAQSRPRATSTGPPAMPSPLSLDRLLEMSLEDISSLPISMLKSILFQNHVNARLLIEKSDLVERVKTLVNEERKDRQREALFREQEEQIEAERQRERYDELERERQERDAPSEGEEPPVIHVEVDSSSIPPQHTDADMDTDTHQVMVMPEEEENPHPPLVSPPKPVLSPAAMASGLERTGLCVICQDEEANIAIVDCGHMAMCRNCSDLIMSSTRECPLCRTRIVTEARLLRIFKA